ncbi:MAG: radical SAM protein [Thermoplasmata archaeon]
MDIRVSSGTASYLGLKKIKCMERPTTAYVLIPGAPCRGKCVYCPQSSTDGKWLSRISWPSFGLNELTEHIKGSDLQRVCIQSPDVDGYEDRIRDAVSLLEETKKPVSVSAPPLPKNILRELRKGPVDRIGVGIDAVTDDLRRKTKKGYAPMIFWNYLGDALDVYGKGHVTAHMIAGMGEDLEQLAHAAYRASKNGAVVSLFSYVSKGKEVDLRYYRQAQLLTHLIEIGYGPYEALSLTHYPTDIREHVEEGTPFRTKGCPGCNRPYYTTRPGKEHRNYPREPTWEEIQKIASDLRY